MKALVLSGGGARALAHVGAIKALAELGFVPDLIVGVSMGALIGAGYSALKDPEKIFEITMSELEKTRFNMKYSKFVSGNFSKLLVKLGCWYMNTFKALPLLDAKLKILKKIRWEDLKIPFLAVAVDIKTGELVVLKRGDGISLQKALRASMAMPGVLKPVKFGKKTLADGGVITNLPVEVALEYGADFVVALDATREAYPESGTANSHLIILDSYRNARIVEWEAEKSTVHIKYDLDGMDSLEFKKGRWAVMQGLKSAHDALKGGELSWIGR